MMEQWNIRSKRFMGMIIGGAIPLLAGLVHAFITGETGILDAVKYLSMPLIAAYMGVETAFPSGKGK